MTSIIFLQAQHKIKNNDIAAAGRQWRTACQWPCCAMSTWVAIVLPLVLLLYIDIGNRNYNTCFAKSKWMCYTRSYHLLLKSVYYATINLIVRMYRTQCSWYHQSCNELYTAVHNLHWLLNCIWVYHDNNFMSHWLHGLTKLSHSLQSFGLSFL